MRRLASGQGPGSADNARHFSTMSAMCGSPAKSSGASFHSRAKAGFHSFKRASEPTTAMPS